VVSSHLRRSASWFVFALFSLAAPAVLSAQFLKVELSLGGLDCASCAGSVEKAYKRIRGVESASLASDGKKVSIALKADNAVRLEQLRDAAKGIGYTPGEARVVARGILAEKEGKWTFTPAGAARSIPSTPPPDGAAAGVEILVEGVVSPPPDSLRITAARRADTSQ
jgi:copper chaperone CopZ